MSRAVPEPLMHFEGHVIAKNISDPSIEAACQHVTSDRLLNYGTSEQKTILKMRRPFSYSDFVISRNGSEISALSSHESVTER